MSKVLNYVLYKNKTYGFLLQIPTWWKRHVFVVEEHCMKEAQLCINFHLKYRRPIKGITHTNIFQIVVFRNSKKQWMKDYGDSPFIFLRARNGLVFAAIHPGEPPEEFLNPDGMDYNRKLLEFKRLSRMINKDLPVLLKSFRFIPN
ncbi:hypothetical protein [Ammoniphilus sp. CFH 90114]|uniref:hypothetical protein n=1 Tax=Ammoniphilus sp. CFH 90114 TaxID=2493665 RepID=UPI00100EB8C5|nr:hypothetical protein [Ammoniphilus sp. CFH 90114]RXT06447.1 hypothetical protein EIZ39_15365 [Ammoniphilus sp. CFH 90114]